MKARAAILAAALIATSACNNESAGILKSIFPGGVADDDGSGGNAAEQLLAKLQQCGIITSGNVPDLGFVGTGGNDALVCLIQCAATLSCDELDAFFCQDGIGTIGTGFATCFENCSLTCDGGNQVTPFQVCDGRGDCEDGSDEEDCPMFVCDDGETLPPDFECDGFEDCLDGSDEVDCPTFACNDGEVIPEEWVCDFEEDCVDGSDEVGCAELACMPDMQQQTP